jgi:hypothetical protein
MAVVGDPIFRCCELCQRRPMVQRARPPPPARQCGFERTHESKAVAICYRVYTFQISPVLVLAASWLRACAAGFAAGISDQPRRYRDAAGFGHDQEVQPSKIGLDEHPTAGQTASLPGVAKVRPVPPSAAAIGRDQVPGMDALAL